MYLHFQQRTKKLTAWDRASFGGYRWEKGWKRLYDMSWVTETGKMREEREGDTMSPMMGTLITLSSLTVPQSLTTIVSGPGTLVSLPGADTTSQEASKPGGAWMEGSASTVASPNRDLFPCAEQPGRTSLHQSATEVLQSGANHTASNNVQTWARHHGWICSCSVILLASSMAVNYPPFGKRYQR